MFRKLKLDNEWGENLIFSREMNNMKIEIWEINNFRIENFEMKKKKIVWNLKDKYLQN